MRWGYLTTRFAAGDTQSTIKRLAYLSSPPTRIQNQTEVRSDRELEAAPSRENSRNADLPDVVAKLQTYAAPRKPRPMPIVGLSSLHGSSNLHDGVGTTTTAINLACTP